MEPQRVKMVLCAMQPVNHKIRHHNGESNFKRAGQRLQCMPAAEKTRGAAALIIDFTARVQKRFIRIASEKESRSIFKSAHRSISRAGRNRSHTSKIATNARNITVW